jgi:hypothetical protein
VHKKLTKATEALKNYKRKNENSPEKKAVERATEAVTHKDEAIESIIVQVFQLYSNLLMEEARRPWSTILKNKLMFPIERLVWSRTHQKRKKSWSAFVDCMTFHHQTVFQSDTAETQQFYISNGLKNLNRVPIRQFMQRIQQLNGNLDILPCLFYSQCTTKLAKILEPFNDIDLASHILRIVPWHWQGQYELTRAIVPQSVHKLLEVLEHIQRPSRPTRNVKGL